MRKRYPSYKIYAITENAESAHFHENEGLNRESLIGIITDLYLLSNTEYLVCTMSSSVDLAAYQLIKANHGDTSHCVA